MITFFVKGHECFVDECDKDLLQYHYSIMKSSGKKKRNAVYLRRAVWANNKCISHPYLHREIMARIEGRVLERHEEVDHIDLNGLNNQRSNLRLATRGQNSANKAVQSNNTTGYRGVSRKRNKFQAIIWVDKKRIHLGYFALAEDAHKVYVAAAKEHYGEFAYEK